MATITDKGLECKAKLLNGVSTTPFIYIALGSSNTPEATNQTALGSELTTGGAARKVATCGYESGYKSVWSAAFSFTDTLTIYEVGIFDEGSGGNMYSRHVFSMPKNVENGETILFTQRNTETRVTS
ncbi:MAG TPA: hypothetical protein PLY91_09320 [Methanoregulaceae archaeon]|nr:hypothetical protein [Methanoregulaceae archaeon]